MKVVKRNGGNVAETVRKLKIVVLALAVLQYVRGCVVQKKRSARPRCVWVRSWLLRRPDYGYYEKLVAELREENCSDFRNFMRVDSDLWQEILNKVGPHIEGSDTFMRKALTPGMKLAITLRYLASGEIYPSLSYGFRVARNTISKVIRETCKAIITAFMGDVIKCPTNPEEWRSVARDFSSIWNFENTIGALDGKHVAIRRPPNGGSLYFNYKGFHSIVLLALVDARYKFLYIDVGANGNCSDGGIFKEGGLFSALDGDYAGLPDDEPLPHDNQPMPYSIVADDAFALRSWLMKPFPRRLMTHDERIFNYRLSRARRVVENAFGILAARFRCLLTTMHQLPENVELIVTASCVLHNLILIRHPGQVRNHVDREDADTHEVIPGTWRTEDTLVGLRRLAGNTTKQRAKLQRLYLKDYYNSEAGSVPWQENMI